jgi:hypothetical protein
MARKSGSKKQQMQSYIRYYKEQTGQRAVDMRDVAAHAKASGWKLPKPKDPLELLAKQFAIAAREEVREDAETGRPYRVNHVYPDMRDGEQCRLWVHIDEAPRDPMVKSFVLRREQMVGDAVQLSFDMEHWNRVHSDENPITLPMDFTDDVEWRRHAPDEDRQAS